MSKINIPEEVQGLQKLEVEILWHCDYYDGPLSGLCRINGEEYWFYFITETEGIPCPLNGKCEDFWEAHPAAEDKDWECPAENEDDTLCYAEIPRRYHGVYESTPENLAEAKRRHEVFKKYVGGHTEYESEKRDLNKVKPQENWEEYYRQAGKWPKLDCRQKLIGYFVW